MKRIHITGRTASGKTTAAQDLSRRLATAGHRVLLLDDDRVASKASTAGYDVVITVRTTNSRLTINYKDGIPSGLV